MEKTQIKILKRKKGYTTKQLAQLLGVPEITIRSYENGQVALENMSLKNAMRLCIALDCELKDFFTESKYKKLTTLKKIKD